VDEKLKSGKVISTKYPIDMISKAYFLSREFWTAFSRCESWRMILVEKVLVAMQGKMLQEHTPYAGHLHSDRYALNEYLSLVQRNFPEIISQAANEMKKEYG
jgi:hypothetical protein